MYPSWIQTESSHLWNVLAGHGETSLGNANSHVKMTQSGIRTVVPPDNHLIRLEWDEKQRDCPEGYLAQSISRS